MLPSYLENIYEKEKKKIRGSKNLISVLKHKFKLNFAVK